MKKMKVVLGAVALVLVSVFVLAFTSKGTIKYTFARYYENGEDSITIVKSREELDDYINTNMEKLYLDVEYVGYDSFTNLVQEYGEDYFKNKDLAIINVNDGTMSCKFSLDNITCDNGNVIISLNQYFDKEYIDCVCTGYLIIVEVDKLGDYKSVEYKKNIK